MARRFSRLRSCHAFQSGIHGGEITYWVQHKLFKFLKENLKAGEVTLIPCANPAAWEQLKIKVIAIAGFQLRD